MPCRHVTSITSGKWGITNTFAYDVNGSSSDWFESTTAVHLLRCSPNPSLPFVCFTSCVAILCDVQRQAKKDWDFMQAQILNGPGSNLSMLRTQCIFLRIIPLCTVWWCHFWISVVIILRTLLDEDTLFMQRKWKWFLNCIRFSDGCFGC